MAKKKAKAKKAAGQAGRTARTRKKRAGRGGNRGAAKRTGNRSAARRGASRKAAAKTSKRASGARRGAAAARAKSSAARPKAAAARRKSAGARPSATAARGMRAPGKLTLAPALPRAEKTAKFSRGTRHLDESGNVILPDALGSGADSGGQSGDLQGLSEVESADSESVVELLEDGQAFEAEAVSGVENAPDADAGEVKTHEVPEDDVPGEYDDQ